MLIIIITNIMFFFFLIAYTFYEDWRDSLWFYGTAGRGKKDPHNVLWHKIKYREAILGWLTGVSGAVWLFSVWGVVVRRSEVAYTWSSERGWSHTGVYHLQTGAEPFTAIVLIFVSLTVVWVVRVKLHQWFLRRFKLKYMGEV
jgi:hypothetical protein